VEDQRAKRIAYLKQLQKEQLKKWKDSNEEDTIKRQLKLKKMGLIDRLPWQIDELEELKKKKTL
jgi:hypothetical protein